jgi:cation transport regulator ChaC
MKREREEVTNPSDQRVPGYVEGYVRRFWQVMQHHGSLEEGLMAKM